MKKREDHRKFPDFHMSRAEAGIGCPHRNLKERQPLSFLTSDKADDPSPDISSGSAGQWPSLCNATYDDDRVLGGEGRQYFPKYLYTAQS